MTEMAQVRPQGEVEVLTRTFAADGGIPNNPRLPVLILRGALVADAPAAVRALLEANGWTGTWTDGVFPYHHFHPDAHEALAVASGWAEILLGGPNGESFRVSAGDVLVLPAGTGHCRTGSSADFRICGAYPPGQEDYTILTGNPQEFRAAVAEIATVPMPVTDPVFGKDGPLLRAWGG